MGPDELGPFLHQAHLRDPSAPVTLAELSNPNPEPGTCAVCHAGVLTATAQNLGGQRVTYSSCSTCHPDSAAPPNPLPFTTDILIAPSAAALTFAHGDHLENTGQVPSISDPAGYERIESLGCSACHGDVAGRRRWR